MGVVALNGVLPLPARAAEILEALEITAEVGTHNTATQATERVLEVRVNLDLEEEEGDIVQ